MSSTLVFSNNNNNNNNNTRRAPPSENEQLELVTLAEKFCAYYRIIYKIMKTKLFNTHHNGDSEPEILEYMDKLRGGFKVSVLGFFPINMRTTTMSENNMEIKMIFDLRDTNTATEIEAKYSELIHFFKQNTLKIKNHFYEKTVPKDVDTQFAEITNDFCTTSKSLITLFRQRDEYEYDFFFAYVNIDYIRDTLEAYNNRLDNDC